ncbi:MAG: InlB B-repeat-containing protein [Solirubrobacterales bacterium]
MSGTLRNRLIFLLAVAGAALALLASAPPAPAGNLYWTNINQALPLSVGRSDLSGGNINNRFIEVPGNPYGLFNTSQYIYFTSFEFGTPGFGTIGRANLDGSDANQSFIGGATGPADVYVDDNYIYWANSGSNSIGRANLDGSGVNQDFITGTVNASTIWANDDYIYWGNGSFSGTSSIGRANIDGTGVDQGFISTGVQAPATLVADVKYRYGTNSQGSATISRADLDGTDVIRSFISAGAAGSTPNGLAISGRHLYWSTFSANTMGRARKDGSDLRPSFMSPLSPAAGGPGSVAIDQYMLTVSLAGTGTGTVTSAPAGIDCTGSAGDCQEEYPQATRVTLTPAPGNSSSFTGWGGACSGTGTCTVTMNQAQNVTATFNTLPPPPASYALTVSATGTGSGTVTSSPAGISCGADCTQAFAAGSSVTLTATPADSSSFTGWGGACSGTGTCTVTMSQAQSVTANFSSLPPGSYQLTIDDLGAGSGTVTSSPAGISCGTDCVQSFAAGSSVKLTATPAPQSSFAGWAGPCDGTGSCTVTMNQAQTVSSVFVPTNQFLILWTRARGDSVLTRLRTYDDGRVTQVGTRRTASGARVRACSGAQRIGGPGAATVTCRLNQGARRLLRQRPLRIEVQTTFDPTGGTPRTLTRFVTVPRTTPGFTG